MALAECCAVPENLELRPDHPDTRPGLEVRVCRACGRRHFELTLDAGAIGLRGSGMG